MVRSVKEQTNRPFTGPVSNLQRLWESGENVLTLQPPQLLTAGASDCVKQVAVQARQFDAVLAANASPGEIAVSSLAMAALLKRAGIETIVQIGARDRNRLALQSDLLGIGALGIHNLLIDIQPARPASLLQNADARPVADLHGSALLAAAVRLRDEGRFISGSSIKQPPVFYIGAFFSLEERFQIEALSGAQFVVTPPVDDVHRFIAAFAAFQASYPDFLRTRPLLVSLPLTTPFAGESIGAGEAGIQQLAASTKALRGCQAIRGFNITVGRQSDLAALEQIVRTINAQ
ncbi:MAG TPA: hypothetical protein VF844_20845 [Ktedonobacteraceae bacterium]